MHAKKAFFPVTGRNRYCGPTSVSALLGVSKDEVATKVAFYRGHGCGQNIKGISLNEMQVVLCALTSHERIVTVRYLRGERWPLLKWRQRVDVESKFDEGYGAIVNVTDHYVAARKSLILDTLQLGEARHYVSAKCANWRVKAVLWVKPA